MTAKKLTLVVAALAMVIGVATVALAADPAFTGAAKCKMCHNKTKSGKQYAAWSASKHAGAYAALATDEAKAIAAEKGLGDPQQADECLKCHVTAHGIDAARLGKKYSVEEGVSCEACHGAGDDYDSNKIMKAIVSGETDGATVGLVTPTAAVCTGCHNEESPTFKGFDFDEYVAKIAHPIPEEHLATYK